MQTLFHPISHKNIMWNRSLLLHDDARLQTRPTSTKNMARVKPKRTWTTSTRTWPTPSRPWPISEQNMAHVKAEQCTTTSCKTWKIWSKPDTTNVNMNKRNYKAWLIFDPLENTKSINCKHFSTGQRIKNNNPTKNKWRTTNNKNNTIICSRQIRGFFYHIKINTNESEKVQNYDSCKAKSFFSSRHMSSLKH